SPCIFRQRVGESEPIAALERKRAALVSAHPPTYGVFPVSGVHGDLRDITTTVRRPPRRVRRADAPPRSTEVWPVPGFAVVCFIQQTQQELAVHGLWFPSSART